MLSQPYATVAAMNSTPLMDPTLPGVRLVHSANSLATLMADPAWYQLIYVEGRRFDSAKEPPLGFGAAYHAALEAGEEMLRTSHNWGEALECSMTAARAALVGDLWEDRYRTPRSLLAAVEGYWRHWRGDHKPLAIEVPWTIELPISSPCGVPYKICGRFDAIAEVFGRAMLLERKHTTRSLDRNYWEQYRSAVQTRTYALAVHSRGNVSVCLDVCRLHLADPKRGERRPPEYARQIFEFTPADLETHLEDITGWLRAAEAWARSGHWPRRSSPWGPGSRWKEILELPVRSRLAHAPEAQPMRHPLQSVMATDEVAEEE